MTFYKEWVVHSMKTTNLATGNDGSVLLAQDGFGKVALSRSRPIADSAYCYLASPGQILIHTTMKRSG